MSGVTRRTPLTPSLSSTHGDQWPTLRAGEGESYGLSQSQIAAPSAK